MKSEKAKTISIGAQQFDRLREGGFFYIDKTDFIRQWWDAGDVVTLITRPRRFGKTLNMSMLDCFFSTRYAGRRDLFEGLSIWEDARFRQLQGTLPCIFLTFAGVKQNTFKDARDGIIKAVHNAWQAHAWLKNAELSDPGAIERFEALGRYLSSDSPETTIADSLVTYSLYDLSSCLHECTGCPVLILLDEYDTPLQEAWIGGYWEKLISFVRTLFNNTFKTNEHLLKALLTGITRVSRESIFSDLNNLKVVTVTSDDYADSFGFTQEEVFSSLELQGLHGRQEKVKLWYDGFCFGKKQDIYNPWSITEYLDTGVFDTYWANTSSNSLVSALLQKGSVQVKKDLERLLCGQSLDAILDEQIVFSQLADNENALWSLLLASGYMKAEGRTLDEDSGDWIYRLSITNLEVRYMFQKMIRRWFGGQNVPWRDFVGALIKGELEEMNLYMNQVSKETFSSFDTGTKPSDDSHPERFYHGFVLGLLAGEVKRYEIRSNRESGYGRYDVVMIPRNPSLYPVLPAVIMEFKVMDRKKEASLHDTAQEALRQIRDLEYNTEILERGIKPEQIHYYGFAFQGKRVLIKTD